MLKITNISKTFNPKTPNEKTALKNFSLELKDGDFVTVIGSNGAGKSTLFNAIAGAFWVDEGKIELDGENITYLPEYKRASSIGRLFQDPIAGTAPGMSIEENMALVYLKCNKRGPFARLNEADREYIRKQLALLDMGLEDRLEQPVGLLSGGQRQALTLLMATMAKPKLLLLDEHTAALDPAIAAKVLKLTKKIVEENHITTLMVTHNMQQALDLGNRTLMMDNGHIVFDTEGEQRRNLTTDDLLNEFKKRLGKNLDNDRILLSE